jgi:cytochrome c2
MAPRMRSATADLRVATNDIILKSLLTDFFRMPANEQTWRDQKKMHVIFAVSAVIMGIATIWMMAADHMREWKGIQLQDRKKDAWMLASRRDSLAALYDVRTDAMEADVRELDSQAIDSDIIDKFKLRVLTADAAPADGSGGPAPEVSLASSGDEPKFARLNERVRTLDEAAAAVADLRQRIASDQAESAPTGGESEAESAEDAEDAAAANADEQAALRSAEDSAIAARQKVLDELQTFISEARRRETALVAKKKAINGERTAVVSELGIKIGEGAAKNVISDTQARIDGLNSELESLTAQIASAKDYRLDLEGYVGQANAEKSTLLKQIDTMKTELARLDEQVYKNTSNWKEAITRLPVLNALYSGNIRVEQNWLPDMTINYNFAQAARFDRCTTCHRAISTTAPGTATDPLYPTLKDEDRNLTVTMATPEELPAKLPGTEEERNNLLLQTYGLALSESGIIDEAKVTVHYVLPDTPAAKAGLQSGDQIDSIGGQPPADPIAARVSLLTMVTPASQVTIDVHRGLDHPFTAHPRLDLYLSDLSPHPQKDIGCTICHDGQGSGTSFAWTSHTPDDAAQQDKWAEKLGWFDNHHWIFPMKPARFVESNCLKCHHQKGPLEPSERFPEPPAPTLVEGWSIVEDFGCFGCHEVNGYDSPKVTVGPDVRLEPAFHEAAAQVRALVQPVATADDASDEDRNLVSTISEYAQRIIDQPGDVEARDLLYAELKHDEARATDPEEETVSLLPAEAHKLAPLLKTAEMPGKMRKVGPSLRYLNSKVDYDWAYAWIRKPQDFRETTKMPQFFGLYEHLNEDPAELHDSLRFEPLEIRALTEYLLNKSSEFKYVEREEGVTDASAERGKWLFQSRGCLACHSHAEFPGIAQDQGPNLTGLSAKLNTDKGRNWLYSWLKQPNLYHARTVMPDLFLDPIEVKDAQGQPTGERTDPAADIAAFLLNVESDWQPQNVPARGEFTAQEKADLIDLAVLWLKSDTIPTERARNYLENGIPEAQAAKLKTDEQLLVNWSDSERGSYNQDENTRVQRQLEYVARRTIGKYGCFGCHDIPGFEDAKPIGTALVDWGRKETSKLAFENIHKFLETHGIDPKPPTGEELSAARSAKSDDAEEPVATESAGHEGALHAEHLDPGDFGDKPEGYFVQSLNSHGRDGFLWQKLRYPRSYDYKTTRNKNFNERLRMPKFPFNDQQREAVMTFVLGLVKEPPATKYLYKPTGRALAIAEGKAVLEQFNCAGCHTLRMEQWQISYDENTFEAPPEMVDYPFLAPKFNDQQIAASMAKDYGGFMHATLEGEPVTDVETGARGLVDEDRAPITLQELKEAEAEEGETIPVFYRFNLWEDTLLKGQAYLRGGGELLVPANRDGYGPASGSAYPAWGGELARYLFPHAIANARSTGSQANATEAWGWLPPPLMDEGVKVQTDWLHDFLMDPTHLRPAVVLRMPNFHMSSEEAAKLVDYFAAASGAEFPYEYRPERRPGYLAQVSLQQKDPLSQAMNIVVDQQYCVKCHTVGDFKPQGDPYTFGPNLSEVHGRLRPTYVRNWIANPVRILPYTGMPKNIPYHPTDSSQDGINESLYPGDSIQQLTALVNLLMNYDVYAMSKTAVAPLVQAAAAKSQAAAGANGAAGAGQPAADQDGADGGAADESDAGNSEPAEGSVDSTDDATP